jgi:hypothetical protein
MTELGLLDTSTVILLGRIQDPATLPDESVIMPSRWPSCRSDHTSPTQKRNVLPARLISSKPRTISTSLRLTRVRGPCFRRSGRRATNRWAQAGSSGLRCPDCRNGNLRGASAVHLQSRRLRAHSWVGHARRPASRCREGVIEYPCNCKDICHRDILSCLGRAQRNPYR